MLSVRSRWVGVGVAVVLFAALAGGCNKKSSPSEPACSFTVSTTAVSVGASGGTSSVDVSTTSGCAWTAQTGESWLSITSGASSTGPGSVGFTVGANPLTTSRTGTLTVAGHSVTVTQEGAPVPCTYTVSPANVSFDKDGGAGTLTITTPAACPWTAVSGASWLTITSAAQGTGNGTVAYTVAKLEDPAGRNTTISVAGHTIDVAQSGDVGSCQYSVAPVQFNPCMVAGYEMTATITTATACPWTASPSASWLTLTRGSSGTGTGVVGFTVSPNFDAPRLGLVMVRWPTPTAGQNVQVAQAGCHYVAMPSSFPIAAGGGTGTFNVFQSSDPNSCGGPLQDQCVWSAVADVSWITITSTMPKRGDDTVHFSVAANPGTSARVGTITVRDQTVTITQSGS
jgi:Putative binding domain, N-terminal/Viral BACON domain